MSLAEKARPFYRFRIDRSWAKLPGATEVVVCYPGYIVNGESELSVAQAQFLRDPHVHHEPVDVYGRQGFSGKPDKMERFKGYLEGKGFEEGKF